MIEGGGLGVFAPEEVGPVSMQAPNGVIDVLVADEAKAVRAAKRYLELKPGTLLIDLYHPNSYVMNKLEGFAEIIGEETRCQAKRRIVRQRHCLFI